jgi:transposase
MKAAAYANCEWTEYGPFSKSEDAARYKGISFTEEIYGAPLRLIVLESSSLRDSAERAYAKKEAELQLIIKSLTKNHWQCLADAEKECERLLKMKQLELFNCEIKIEKLVQEKWPRGRRGKETKPKLIETYHTHIENVAKREEKYQEFIHRESSIVLVSNATELSDEEIIKVYKGQHVVENSFRTLKSPQLASVIYLKNQTRIEVLSMILTFSLLLRALIQYRLREGLNAFNEKHPGEIIYAGWGGRPLENPTFKLLYEHAINCCFERESSGHYSFAWLSNVTESRVAPLMELIGISLEQLVR